MSTYKDVLPDNVHLALFLASMQKFDRLFCDAMNRGVDYTMRLEIRGNKGKLIHCRVVSDSFDRPADAPDGGSSG